MANNTIPRIDAELRKDNISDVVQKTVKVLRPQWNNQYFYKRNLQGFVNITVIVTRDGEDTGDALVLRSLSEEFGGSIKSQYTLNEFIHDHGLGPALLAFIDNGICMEFVKGNMILWSDFRRLSDPAVWRPIARTFARWHQKLVHKNALDRGLSKQETVLWGPVVRHHWEHVLSQPTMEQYRHLLPTAAKLQEEERDVVQRLTSQGDLDVGFCHVDLNMSNIAINDVTGEAIFIDYDFAGINYVQVDLSWFFHIYQDIENLSLDSYPSLEYRRNFLEEYLKYRKQLDGEAEVTSADVDKLLIQVEKCRLLQYLRSVVDGPCMWYNTKRDPEWDEFLDLMPVAIEAWKRYQRTKEEILKINSI